MAVTREQVNIDYHAWSEPHNGASYEAAGGEDERVNWMF